MFHPQLQIARCRLQFAQSCSDMPQPPAHACAAVRPKMLYSAGKDALKRNLPGVTIEMQANDNEEMTLEEVDTRVRAVASGA